MMTNRQRLQRASFLMGWFISVFESRKPPFPDYCFKHIVAQMKEWKGDDGVGGYFIVEVRLDNSRWIRYGDVRFNTRLDAVTYAKEMTLRHGAKTRIVSINGKRRKIQGYILRGTIRNA